MNKLLLLVATISIILLACGKDNPPSNTNNTNNNQDNLPPSGVYVAGDSIDVFGRKYPVYWVNGKQVHLSDSAVNASGNGIAVSDSNVYVSCDGVGLGKDITYWKNTTGIYLVDSTIIEPHAATIALSGNDVYIVGTGLNNFGHRIPAYWKNQGLATKMATYNQTGGDVCAINISGSDIYIAGATYDPATGLGTSPPCYWKNGTPTFLHSVSPSSGRGLAKSICVSGSDIHVVGEVYPIGSGSDIGWAVYWKNGVATELGPPTQISEANGVTVVGSDVYIAGSVAGADRVPHATYWKNGVAVTLDLKYSVATAITVSGNDVYVAGNRGVDSALYWKNGSPFVLGPGRAYAIAFKK